MKSLQASLQGSINQILSRLTEETGSVPTCEAIVTQLKLLPLYKRQGESVLKTFVKPALTRFAEGQNNNNVRSQVLRYQAEMKLHY